MIKINIADLDRNLLADLGDSTSFEAFEAPHADATVSNQAYHIAFSSEHGRGGIVFFGSGSSGLTFWTDAASAEEVLQRHLDDDMIG